jgi:hypothetical protein
MGTSLLNSERDLSCHLMFFFIINGYIWFVLRVFIKLLARKERDTQGYGVKIMKLNEKFDWPIELSIG